MFRCLSLIAAAILIINLSGCAAIRTGIATLRSTSDFIALKSDSRILYEPGAEEFAAEVAGYLPDAIAVVEKEQYRQFAKPVQVFICATESSYLSHTGQDSRGVMVTKLFLSAEMIKKIQDGNSSKMILTHELSHLHLYQRLGLFGYSRIPKWFLEGFAVITSGGAPAVDVSEDEATKAILSGKSIKPDVHGSLLFDRFWHSSGLKPHMIYRQSAMFVTYIKRLDETKFRTFMLLIEDGRDFGDSFNGTYGMSIKNSWKMFCETLLKTAVI